MKVWAYDLDKDIEVTFESTQPCCTSCIEDDEMGYDNGALACCCIHSQEYLTKKENELKI